MKKLVRLVILGAVLCPIISIAISCSEEADCSMTARPMVNCILYRVDPETQYVENDTLDSLTVTAYGTDSIKKDTIIIYQKNTPYFLSMDCGYQMKQAITSVTCTRISLDSIYIKDNEAGIYGKENLKLFY